MADLLAFSSEDFNTNTWVNSAIADKAEGESLETFLATVTLKLHLLSQDCTDQLETSMMETVSSMPRVVSEISRLEDNLRGINAELEHISSQLKSLDEKNVGGIEDLSRLDTIKSNMESCKATLREHARWSQLEKEARTFLESGGRLVDSADRIETMRISLEILQHTPGHDERSQVYNTLNETFIGALKPRLQRDIMGSDVTSLIEYMQLYVKLKRENELEEEYIKSRPALLRERFLDFKSHHSLVPWLQNYFEYLNEFVNKENSFVEIIFGREKQSDLVLSMICQVMKENTTDLSNRLKSCQSPKTCLETYNIIDGFVKKLTSKEPFNRLDKAKKINLFKSFFGGHLLYIDSYVEDESVTLQSEFKRQLDSVGFGNISDTSSADPNGGDDFLSDGTVDPLDALAAYADKLVAISSEVFAAVDASLHRSAQFFGGLKTKAVFRVMGTALALFLKAFLSKIDDLRVACGAPPDRSTSLTSPTESSAVGGGGSPRGKQVDSFTVSDTASPFYKDDNATASRLLAEKWVEKLESNGDMNMRSLLPSALKTVQSVGKFVAMMREQEQSSVGILSEIFNSTFRDSSQINSSAVQSPGIAILHHLIQSEPSIAAELRSFLSSATATSSSASSSGSSSSIGLFSATQAPLLKCKVAACSLIFDLCTSQPEKVLNGMADDDTWSAPASPGCSVDYYVNTGEILPQSSITQVGEHLLSIVQELETFTSLDAIRSVCALSGDVASVGAYSRGWRLLNEIISSSSNSAKEDTSGIESIFKKKSCKIAVVSLEIALFGAATSGYPGSYDIGESNPVEVATIDESSLLAMFVNDWLAVICDAILGLVFVQIASISCLSARGGAQLLVDVNYLINVLTAMGVGPHPLLYHIIEVVKADSPSHLSILEAYASKSNDARAVRKLDMQLLSAVSKGSSPK